MQQAAAAVESSGEHLPGDLAAARPARAALSLIIEVVPVVELCCQAAVVDEGQVVEVAVARVGACVDVPTADAPPAVAKLRIQILK